MRRAMARRENSTALILKYSPRRRMEGKAESAVRGVRIWNL